MTREREGVQNRGYHQVPEGGAAGASSQWEALGSAVESMPHSQATQGSRLSTRALLPVTGRGLLGSGCLLPGTSVLLFARTEWPLQLKRKTSGEGQQTLAAGSRPEGYRWGTGRVGYSPQGILSPRGRQAHNEVAGGRVVGELEGCAGEMLLEHRGGGSPLSDCSKTGGTWGEREKGGGS